MIDDDQRDLLDDQEQEEVDPGQELAGVELDLETDPNDPFGQDISGPGVQEPFGGGDIFGGPGVQPSSTPASSSKEPPLPPRVRQSWCGASNGEGAVLGSDGTFIEQSGLKPVQSTSLINVN